MQKKLFVHPKDDYTGSTRVLANIILNESPNFEVTIITDKSNNKGFLSDLKNVNLIGIWHPTIRGKNIPILSGQIIQLQIFILTLILIPKYKYIYINTIVPYAAAIAARIFCKKIIYHIHEHFLQKSVSINIMEYIFNHTKAHRIFVSKYAKECYPNNNQCTVEIKYNKLPAGFLNNVRIKPLPKRKRNRILMLSSLYKAKGLDMFIKLAHLLPEYKFTLILSAEQTQIEKFFNKTAIPYNCKILPMQSNIQPFLEKTDLVLNLSNPSLCIETFGMTILEAMPYGIPGIVPNVGGPIEIIEDGYNGYCVDVTNINEIKNKIMYILDNNNYYQFVENSLNRFNTLFK